MQYLDLFARYATLMTALVAIISVAVTLHQWQRNRSLSMAAQLVQTIQSPEFTRAIVHVLQLPPHAPPERVRGDTQTLHAVYVVSHVFESLGLMVFYRVLPLHLVDHLVGGYVRASWERLEDHARAQRAVLGATFGEWFQWLVERMIENPAPGKETGAALAYRRWRL